jgi:hypothetical protein
LWSYNDVCGHLKSLKVVRSRLRLFEVDNDVCDRLWSFEVVNDRIMMLEVVYGRLWSYEVD